MKIGLIQLITFKQDPVDNDGALGPSSWKAAKQAQRGATFKGSISTVCRFVLPKLGESLLSGLPPRLAIDAAVACEVFCSPSIS